MKLKNGKYHRLNCNTEQQQRRQNRAVLLLLLPQFWITWSTRTARLYYFIRFMFYMGDKESTVEIWLECRQWITIWFNVFRFNSRVITFLKKKMTRKLWLPFFATTLFIWLKKGNEWGDLLRLFQLLLVGLRKILEWEWLAFFWLSNENFVAISSTTRLSLLLRLCFYYLFWSLLAFCNN